MKTIVTFAAFIMLASATYTPKWSSCSAPSDAWQPNAVTFDHAPVHHQEDSFQACGSVQDDVIVGSFHMEVRYSGMVVRTEEVELDQKEIYPGSQYCFNHSVLVPPLARGTFEVTLELQDKDDETNLGCVDISLNIAKH